jgi:hypothetical protein
LGVFSIRVNPRKSAAGISGIEIQNSSDQKLSALAGSQRARPALAGKHMIVVATVYSLAMEK